jgi:hypothetical protein
MKIFWENIKRYPRFLITSIGGLAIILIENILKPKIIKNPLSYYIITFSFLIFLFELIIVIFNEILNI